MIKPNNIPELIEELWPSQPSVSITKQVKMMQAAMKYKQATAAMEIAEHQREEAKNILLELAEGQEIIVDGVSIHKIEPKPTVDWQAAAQFFKLTAKKLEPFLKQKAAYFRLTVKREVSL